MEDDILMSVYKFLKEPKNCVLCFDGLQVLASEYDLNQDYINELQVHFVFEFAVKPMNEGFKMPENIPLYKDECDFPGFDYRDPYTYIDFVKQFGNRHFGSYQA